MVGGTSDWKNELGRWLKPFLDRLRLKARRRMCPLYVSGLIGPGDRKSIQPMRGGLRLALGECDQLRHFIAAGAWDATPVETELLVQADKLVGKRLCSHVFRRALMGECPASELNRHACLRAPDDRLPLGTNCPQCTCDSLFDHLVGAQEHAGRNLETKRLEPCAALGPKADQSKGSKQPYHAVGARVRCRRRTGAPGQKPECDAYSPRDS